MTNTSYNVLYINVNIINIFIWTSFVKKKSCQSVSSKQDSANIIICSSICKVWLWNEKNISGQTRNILMMPEMEVTVRATPFTQNSICSVRSFRSSRSAMVFSFLSRSWSKWKFSANSLESIRSSIVQEDAKHWSCKLDGHDLGTAAMLHIVSIGTWISSSISVSRKLRRPPIIFFFVKLTFT